MELSDHKRKRIFLFLFGCILVRSILVLVAKNTKNTKMLQILGCLAILPAIGFIVIYLTKSRKTGPETFGEKIWWNNLRPLHALLYLCFAISAIRKQSYSWIFLAIDVIVGLTAWSIHTFN